jgi:malate/lactate dehydrogenase
MATTFKFYWDSALTEQVTNLDPIRSVQKEDGSSGPEQFHLFIGSTVASKKIQADSNPGVDQIEISVSDSSSGSGEPVAAVKLALTSLGLADAVAGEALDVGTEILSEEENALSIWVELEDQTGEVGTYTDLKLISNTVVEVAA